MGWRGPGGDPKGRWGVPSGVGRREIAGCPHKVVVGRLEMAGGGAIGTLEMTLGSPRVVTLVSQRLG